MKPFVLILEDNPERISLMRVVLAQLLPNFEHVFFPTVPQTLVWMDSNLANVVFISLDHDLEPVAPIAEQPLDPGCGQDVADYLGARPPICPVIVHTSNVLAGSSMVCRLRDGGWSVFRTYPRDGMNWIATDWASDIQTLLQRGLIFG